MNIQKLLMTYHDLKVKNFRYTYSTWNLGQMSVLMTKLMNCFVKLIKLSAGIFCFGYYTGSHIIRNSGGTWPIEGAKI